MFLNYKAGLVSDSVIGQVLGEQVRLELVRRWRVYMGGAEAYQDAQRVRERCPESESDGAGHDL